MRPVVLLAIVLALAAGGAVAWLATRGGSSPVAGTGSGPSSPDTSNPPPAGPSLFTMTPKPSVGTKDYRSLATDDHGNAWAIDYEHMTVVQINNVDKPIFRGSNLGSGTELVAMAYANQSLWLVDQGHQQLVRITTQGQLPKLFPIVGGVPISRRPVFVNDRVWVATHNKNDTTHDTLTGFDLSNPGPPIVVRISFAPTDLSANKTSVYAIGGGHIVRVDSASLTKQTRTLAHAKGVFATDGRVWVALNNPDRAASTMIARLNPESLAPVRITLGVKGSAETIAEANGVLWVALQPPGGAKAAEIVELDLKDLSTAPKPAQIWRFTTGNISKPIFSGTTTLWMKTGGARPGFTPITLTRP
jgi:hypothetical protein